MRTGFGVLLALWGAFFVVFGRRVAHGQYTHGRGTAGPGPHRVTTTLNMVAGIALTACGVLLAVGAI